MVEEEEGGERVVARGRKRRDYEGEMSVEVLGDVKENHKGVYP